MSHRPPREAFLLLEDGKLFHGIACTPTRRITHRNLNDDTIEGLALKGRDVFSVQYHPEAAPGPYDAQDLFEQFLRKVERHLGAG